MKQGESVGEATPPQLRLLTKRLRRALSVSVGVLVGGDRGGVAQIEPFAQANVLATSKVLLDKIRATADQSPPCSAAALPRPIVSANALGGIAGGRFSCSPTRLVCLMTSKRVGGL
jgi:hypothetical protein